MTPCKIDKYGGTSSQVVGTHVEDTDEIAAHNLSNWTPASTFRVTGLRLTVHIYNYRNSTAGLRSENVSRHAIMRPFGDYKSTIQ